MIDWRLNLQCYNFSCLNLLIVMVNLILTRSALSVSVTWLSTSFTAIQAGKLYPGLGNLLYGLRLRLCSVGPWHFPQRWKESCRRGTGISE